MDNIQLSAAQLLNDDWEPVSAISPGLVVKAFGDEQLVRKWIQATSIVIAPKAETVSVTPAAAGAAFGYLRSEIGMNIILPKGTIDELRFQVTLSQTGGAEDTFAADGFPNSSISTTSIVGGQIKIGISNAFKFIPVAGPAIGDLLSIDLNPWTFHIGTLKKIQVAFSGGLTTEPGWYFKKAGIQNDTIRIAMLLKKSAATTEIKADVQASWLYDPGLLHKQRVGSDVKSLTIYRAG
jgi:hypothetical protein